MRCHVVGERGNHVIPTSPDVVVRLGFALMSVCLQVRTMNLNGRQLAANRRCSQRIEVIICIQG
jgi:tRNA U54 and U55 pseudouridine synthase Pus10